MDKKTLPQAINTLRSAEKFKHLRQIPERDIDGYAAVPAAEIVAARQILERASGLEVVELILGGADSRLMFR